MQERPMTERRPAGKRKSSARARTRFEVEREKREERKEKPASRKADRECPTSLGKVRLRRGRRKDDPRFGHDHDHDHDHDPCPTQSFS
jgi:hypothetical protein